MRLTYNIYTKAVCALTLLLVLLATGCRNEREDMPTGKRGRALSLTASMPWDGGGMRVELKKSTDNSTLIAKWKSGDKVTFVFEQGDVLTDPVEAAIGRIENDGRRAKLRMEVPESIDIEEAYTIYAFCGVPGSGVRIENKEILLDILPLRANRLEDISVPVIAKRDISPEGEEEMALPFDYLGSIEYVDLKNGSSTTLRVNNCHLYAVDPAAEEWRYLPRNGKYHLYKPMTDEVMEADGDKPNPLEESGSAVSVAPGATHTFAVWHRPTGNSIPEFGISVQTDNGTQLSKNKKIAKAFSMTPGKAYRVRAEWKDNRLTILGDDVEEDLPSITLTTEKEEGETITLGINAEPEDQADVWIDLNNNKVKDAGESVTVFGPHKEYTLGSQTITVHGKVTKLSCPSNSLTSLDVSKNTALTWLYCDENSLTSLDVSKNTALTYLYCDENSLTSLDVSKNTALTELYCHSNSLTSLDVKNTALTELVCYSNSLTSLDVSKTTELEWLDCDSNSLTSLDVSKNTALRVFGCNSNSLTSLDVSKNTALTELYCDENSLTSLDVSKNTALTRFSCEKNPNLSSLKISSSINDELWVNHCKLSTETLNEIFTTLPDVKGQTEGAKKIWIADNPGTDACNKKIATDKGWTLDVEDTPPAGYSMTMTTEKKVGEKIWLRTDAESADQADVWIDLNNNGTKDEGESVTVFGKYQGYTLGSQTIAVYGKVTVLCCDEESLSSLDVSKNTALTELYCYSNSLTSLDVSKNTALTVLSCYSNSLTSLDVSKNTALTVLYCYSNSLTSLDVSKNTALTELYCYSNSLTSLDMSKNTALTRLDCYSNSLTSLDLSNNTALTRLDCYSNSLTSLDVSKNTKLEFLVCYSNSLTSLDVSKNTALQLLVCYSNSLTSLDVSKNKALKILTCDSNKFTSLDVSKNTALTIFSCSNNPNLSSLKISSSINDALWVNDCKLSAETLNEIFRTLPDVKGLTEGERKIAVIANNPGTDACNKKIAEDKGWTVNIDYD